MSALKQKSRLAALGEAVAKINHDLRNILASSQLLADRLETSQDPLVRKVGPKLIASLDRAIRLCQQTLVYGRAQETPPDPKPTAIASLFEDVRLALGLGDGAIDAGGAPKVVFVNQAPTDLRLDVDPDQMFRALLNLARNAQQALEATERGGVVTVTASTSAEARRST